MGQPSGEFNYKVLYSKPPFSDMPIESIVPIGWSDEFDDEKLMDKNETCTVEVWKDEVIKTVIEEMQEKLVCLPPKEELSLDLASLAFRIENNFLVVSFE